MTEETKSPEAMVLGEACIFPWWLVLLWGILSLVIGILFLTTPVITTVILVTFMGAYWLVGGFFAIGSVFVDRNEWGWKIFLAIINIIAGILILMYPYFSTLFVLSFFVIFIGFWACFIGAAHLFQAFARKDAGNGVLGILSLIFGIILLINPFITVALLPFVAGGFAVIGGLSAIVVSFTAHKAQETVPAP
ncbi:MAG: DUF308 domain-containing protein [Methanoregula sp.]|nr:MAG: DUF308 domain-containing protein [Methanoregula sp.]